VNDELKRLTQHFSSQFAMEPASSARFFKKATGVKMQQHVGPNNTKDLLSVLAPLQSSCTRTQRALRVILASQKVI